VLIGLTALAGLALFWVSGKLFARDSPGTPPGGGAVEISATTNRVLRQVELAAPNDIETGLGGAFVTGTAKSTATVARIPDGPAGRPQPIELGRATTTSPDDLAVGAGAVWASVADALYRADPQELGAARRLGGLPRGGLFSGVAVGAGAVWVVDSTKRAVERVDVAGRRAPRTIPLPGPGDGVAVGEGAVWVPSIQDQTVFRIAPREARVTRSIAVRGAAPGVAAGAGSVWVTSPSRDAVARIDPASGSVSWIGVGDIPTDVCVAHGAVWVANSGSASVSRIDAARGRVVATIRVPPRPNRIASDGRSVWATFLGRPSTAD
jgi:streptogramin lyase